MLSSEKLMDYVGVLSFIIIIFQVIIATLLISILCIILIIICARRSQSEYLGRIGNRRHHQYPYSQSYPQSGSRPIPEDPPPDYYPPVQ